MKHYPVFAGSDYKGSIPGTFEETLQKYNKIFKSNITREDIFSSR